MQNENMAFNFTDTPIVFKENLSARSTHIHKEAVTRAQRYLIAEADLLEIIIEIDKERIYEEFGLTHLTPYCIKHLGLSEDVAANFVRVARKSQQVPELKVAIEEGRLSVTKAKAIASVITSENQSIWIEKAETLSKSKLEEQVAIASPQTRKPEKAKIKGPNRIRVEFELSAEEMKLFRRVQDLISQKMGQSATLAETHNALVQLFLEKNDPVKKAERAQKRNQNSTEAKAETKSEQKAKGMCRSQDHFVQKSRPALKAEIIHALNLRDKGACQAIHPDGSICGQSRWVHFHHKIPHSHGGGDTLDNLITLCSSHHRLWHAQSGLTR